MAESIHSNIIVGRTAPTPVIPDPGDFVPSIADLNFNDTAIGSSVITGALDGSKWTGAGTFIQYCSDTSTSGHVWCRSDNTDFAVASSNNPYSTRKSTGIRIVRRDEPWGDAFPYEPAMGTNLNIRNMGHTLYKGDEYWLRFDMYWPASVSPQTTAGWLKTLQQIRKRSDGSTGGAFYLNIYGTTANPGGWTLDYVENPFKFPDNDPPNIWFYLPEGHPDIASKGAAAVVMPAGTPTWAPGAWVRVEMYQYLSDVTGQARTIVWFNKIRAIDNAILHTLPTTTGRMEDCKFFSFWNGARESTTYPKGSPVVPNVCTEITIANCVMTDNTAPPPETDAGGFPMIGNWLAG